MTSKRPSKRVSKAGKTTDELSYEDLLKERNAWRSRASRVQKGCSEQIRNLEAEVERLRNQLKSARLEAAAETLHILSSAKLIKGNLIAAVDGPTEVLRIFKESDASG